MCMYTFRQGPSACLANAFMFLHRPYSCLAVHFHRYLSLRYTLPKARVAIPQAATKPKRYVVLVHTRICCMYAHAPNCKHSVAWHVKLKPHS